ncbi:hypothetical protein POSPLADRAFT_1150023 [Postia placenta MAD-698-R-SB12]|uniref:A to I editase domain-containing protein n=1 Tax=Postia placenta MAD-698-R-SB12 TaxID=670580 RepID=A0A1X6MSF5_9APHY|nr:hypothetical protein POSPLADRAFT_1150023 [Postia placenta MAD-698-R-SB12]OSX59308.1 hypothetical protein POSPLADRAFT_1150023 [Postia placenta MAD-698-R-SB12]
MAYPAYEAYPQLHRSLSYGQQYGYPRGDYAAYDQPMAAITPGVYGECQTYPQTTYPIYAPQRTASQYAYDDTNYRDSYFPEHYQYSSSAYGTPHATRMNRRRSSMSRRRMHPDGYRRMGSTLIKFKRKGGFRSGITLGEAMSNAHLSGNDSYTIYDLNADHRGKIVLKLRWTGYTSMTYELPVDGYDGRVELQTLARRVARACVHFIQLSFFKRLTIELYTSLHHKLPDGKYTIVASFVLSRRKALKVISLATGSKCLPTEKFTEEGDALHDSHAEVLARRGAQRWFLEEIQRISSGEHDSPWVRKTTDDMFELLDNVEITLYISTVPCGDASTRFLASFQDTEMAALKDSTKFPELLPNVASRGRDNYSLYGVLRTKPGRADSPPTICMSCSDKIARWNVLGIQGAIGSHFLRPAYISTVILGEVEEHRQDMTLEECQRAFHGRLDALDYVLAVCWIADSPKHELYQQTAEKLAPPAPLANYYVAKQSAKVYQLAKNVLQGCSSPFAGWITSGKRWEDFNC